MRMKCLIKKITMCSPLVHLQSRCACCSVLTLQTGGHLKELTSKDANFSLTGLRAYRSPLKNASIFLFSDIFGMSSDIPTRMARSAPPCTSTFEGSIINIFLLLPFTHARLSELQDKRRVIPGD